MKGDMLRIAYCVLRVPYGGVAATWKTQIGKNTNRVLKFFPFALLPICVRMNERNGRAQRTFCGETMYCALGVSYIPAGCGTA